MAEEQYNKMDEVFRQAAEIPGVPPSPEAWEKMNALLDADDKKRRRIFIWWWIPIILGIAVGGYLFRVDTPAPVKALVNNKSSADAPIATRKDPESEEISVPKKRETNIVGETTQALVEKQHTERINGNESNLNFQANINKGKKSKLNKKRFTDNPDQPIENSIEEGRASIEAKPGAKFKRQMPNTQSDDQIPDLEATTISSIEPLAILSTLKYPEKIGEEHDSIIPLATKDKASQKQGNGLPFYLYGSVGPEVSGVNGKGKLRFGMGVGIGMKLTRSFFIQAGIINTNKVYSADGSHYYPKPGSYYDNENLKIQQVEADCHIIEIPLQIGFNIIQRKRNTIFAMAGITASIMQKEFYKYQYTRYGVPAESEYTYRTKSFEPLAGAGISVGYQRKINSRLVLQLNPYYNFPLNGIGEGRVEISSAGIQAGLRYNFNLFK